MTSGKYKLRYIFRNKDIGKYIFEDIFHAKTLKCRALFVGGGRIF